MIDYKNHIIEKPHLSVKDGRYHAAFKECGKNEIIEVNSNSSETCLVAARDLIDERLKENNNEL